MGDSLYCTGFWGGILFILGVLFFSRRRKKLFERREVLTPKPSVEAAQPIECVRVIRPGKNAGFEKGTMIGNYQITEMINSGGMANIYKAIHITTGGIAVLKIPHQQFLNDPKFIDRFGREAELGQKALQ